jgi:hypothetical protein
MATIRQDDPERIRSGTRRRLRRLLARGSKAEIPTNYVGEWQISPLSAA